MANYHVVPRGDAMKHAVHGHDCKCGVEIKTVNSDEPGRFDVWIYHHEVTIEQAVSGPSNAEPIGA